MVESSQVSLLVEQVLVRILEERNGGMSKVRRDVSLIELGLDSLTMIDLAVGIEEVLGIAEFPIQAWADYEASREQPRYTMLSLIVACERLLETGSLEGSHEREPIQVV
jgi:acyl carrier protein